MDSVSIPAHFDGQHFLLDEPCELEPNARLIVTALPNHDAERESWLRLSAADCGKRTGITKKNTRWIW